MELSDSAGSLDTRGSWAPPLGEGEDGATKRGVHSQRGRSAGKKRRQSKESKAALSVARGQEGAQRVLLRCKASSRRGGEIGDGAVVGGREGEGRSEEGWLHRGRWKMRRRRRRASEEGGRSERGRGKRRWWWWGRGRRDDTRASAVWSNSTPRLTARAALSLAPGRDLGREAVGSSSSRGGSVFLSPRDA